jgi:NAD(P)-dependent dehydrogenase (short-subunit alcohol dehydrogenase family)
VSTAIEEERRALAGWAVADIAPQRGRSVVVTGTGGLGYETAAVLARAGAEVILAGRNAVKGALAIERIRAGHAGADIRFELLDLAELASIKAFGARLQAERQSLDVLINNAGVMTPPRRRLTADGFELQFGTNYLGHFALSAYLLPLLRRGQQPRVVNVSSIASRKGALNFDDLQFEQRYQPRAAYRQAKLANLMFAFELQRRSDAAGWGLMSNAAHPGLARTDLFVNAWGPGSLTVRLLGMVSPFLFQSAAQGAWPTLFAATSAEARAGAYYGPDGVAEFKGRPRLAAVVPQAQDAAATAHLWEVSERLTGVSWPA